MGRQVPLPACPKPLSPFGGARPLDALSVGRPCVIARSSLRAHLGTGYAGFLKTRTTVTNRWLATSLHMGNLHEVSRKVNAWTRRSDAALQKQLP